MFHNLFCLILSSKTAYRPNFNSIFLQTGETPYYHGNSYTFTQNSDTITETPDFCLIVRFLPQSHVKAYEGDRNMIFKIILYILIGLAILFGLYKMFIDDEKGVGYVPPLLVTYTIAYHLHISLLKHHH